MIYSFLAIYFFGSAFIAERIHRSKLPNYKKFIFGFFGTALYVIILLVVYGALGLLFTKELDAKAWWVMPLCLIIVSTISGSRAAWPEALEDDGNIHYRKGTITPEERVRFANEKANDKFRS